MLHEFNKDILKKAIDTGKNAVFAYPAGSGKTSAICDYLVEQVKTSRLNRKVIYVAQTKSLLDQMKMSLIEAGIPEHLIFNYHSSSIDYKQCCSKDHLDKLQGKIKNSTIILITHERMKFETVLNFFFEEPKNRFHAKPLVFLDESIEDCNVACMYTRTLKTILRDSGIITREQNHRDYLETQHVPEEAYRKIRDCLLEPDENGHLCNLEVLGITLANDVGFSSGSDMANIRVRQRFENLYEIIAFSIANGNWLEVNGQCYIKIPIAIHESWKEISQVIIMDATAFVNPSLCRDFEIHRSINWNAELIEHYVSVNKDNTRTKLEKNPQTAIDFLEKLDLRRYRKIYLVTFKGKVLDTVEKHLKDHYPDYKIEYFDNKETQQFLDTDIDNTTDELYSDSDSSKKIIYITNFGQTRGSNKFRDCECVIQIGDYRIHPDALKILNMVYENVTSNTLALSNHIQELYRGCIRCDKKMTACSLIDPTFYNFLTQELRSLNFKFKPIEGYSVLSINFGINTDIVNFLFNAKNKKQILHKKDLLDICQSNRWEKVVIRLCNLFKKYEILRGHLFSNFLNEEDFKQSLTTRKNGIQTKDIDLILF
ncbi:MAG: DEAD/DEAH box helicase family protein [Paludibacteraceae bacterium]|nr:DEAD/DEAH box helicase family protein [Paludibacteraceae bacterium]